MVDFHVRGDAREPRKALGAIHEGARVAREIRVKVPFELGSMQGGKLRKGLGRELLPEDVADAILFLSWHQENPEIMMVWLS